MRVLVACEFSGIVREAFRRLGHDAWSCDLLESEQPGPHFQGDVLDHLNDGWDLMIAHPPCTYLANAGVRHMHSIPAKTGKLPVIHGEARWIELIKAELFFLALKNAPIAKIAVENPIPHRYAREVIGPYSQIIQPWMFGHPETKATCLWLKGLPKLQATNIVSALEGSRLHRLPPSPDRWKLRSRTFEGVAEAMASQWGSLE